MSEIRNTAATASIAQAGVQSAASEANERLPAPSATSHAAAVSAKIEAVSQALEGTSQQMATVQKIAGGVREQRDQVVAQADGLARRAAAAKPNSKEQKELQRQANALTMTAGNYGRQLRKLARSMQSLVDTRKQLQQELESLTGPEMAQAQASDAADAQQAEGQRRRAEGQKQQNVDAAQHEREAERGDPRAQRRNPVQAQARDSALDIGYGAEEERAWQKGPKGKRADEGQSSGAGGLAGANGWTTDEG